jgi:hypothetical protein
VKLNVQLVAARVLNPVQLYLVMKVLVKGAYAERRERPFARRAERTARPARVAIRARKPCFFARRRVFGW